MYLCVVYLCVAGVPVSNVSVCGISFQTFCYLVDGSLNPEAKELVSLLRAEANNLIDLLDITEPNADRLKVCKGYLVPSLSVGLYRK